MNIKTIGFKIEGNEIGELMGMLPLDERTKSELVIAYELNPAAFKMPLSEPLYIAINNYSGMNINPNNKELFDGLYYLLMDYYLKGYAADKDCNELVYKMYKPGKLSFVERLVIREVSNYYKQIYMKNVSMKEIITDLIKDESGVQDVYMPQIQPLALIVYLLNGPDKEVQEFRSLASNTIWAFNNLRGIL